MNYVVLVGRLVSDPEVKYANNGNTVTKFRLAVSRKYKKDGQQEADFINCCSFGKTAEFVEKHFKKGMRIGLSGSIQTGSYKNKDGQTVYTTDIVTDSVEFVESIQPKQEKPEEPVDMSFLDIPDSIDDELPFE